MTKPTAEQLRRLQAAHLRTTRTGTAVAQARAALTEAIARDAAAQNELGHAIADVLYGGQPTPATAG